MTCVHRDALHFGRSGGRSSGGTLSASSDEKIPFRVVSLGAVFERASANLRKRRHAILRLERASESALV